jgi:hypothetical protein
MSEPILSGNRRDLLIGAAMGAVAALMTLVVALGSFGGLILLALVPVPLFLAGFERGLKAGLTANLVAFVALALLANWGSAVVLGLSLLVPILALTIAALSKEDGRESRMALVLVGIGVIHFLLTWMDAPTEQEFAKSLASVTGPGGLTVQQGQELVALSLRWIGLVTWMVSGWLMVTGVLAAGLAARAKTPVLSRLWIARVSLPRWYSPLSAVLILAWNFGPEDVAFFASNLLVVQGIGYVLAGLAVVHTAFWRGNIGWGGRFFFYGAICLLSGVGAWLLVAVLGLVEQWAGLRGRMIASRAKADEE